MCYIDGIFFDGKAFLLSPYDGFSRKSVQNGNLIKQVRVSEEKDRLFVNPNKVRFSFQNE